MCLGLGVARVSATPNIIIEEQSIIVELTPTNYKGVVHLGGLGYALSFEEYPKVLKALFSGSIEPVEMHDYYESLGCIGLFKPKQLIAVTDPGRPITDKYRENVDSLLSGVDNPERGIIKGIVSGDKSSMSKRTKKLMANAGISHILAVSGFHIGLISFLPFLFLRSSKNYVRLLAVIGLGVVWGFIAVCGFPNSAIRAGIMITVAIAAVLLGRTPLPFNALCIATWIILFAYPLSLFQIGTQLSIIATAGILSIVSTKNYLLFKIPIAAQAVTSPIVASTFGELPIFFLPINIVASLLVPVIALLVSLGIINDIFIDVAAYLCSRAYELLDYASALLPLAFDMQDGSLFKIGSIVVVSWVFNPVLPQFLTRIVSTSSLITFLLLVLSGLS